MFALTGKGTRRETAGHVSAEPARPFAIPRRLRKPLRFLQRFCTGETAMPPFAGTAGLVAFLAATGIYGGVVGGHFQGTFGTVATTVGLAIADVEVTGNTHTSEIDIIQLLGLDGFTSLATIDADDAREAIALLPWVKTVSVRKTYPGTIRIDLVEHTPHAIWQHGTSLSVIAADGKVIAPYDTGDFASLPLVIGVGADRAAPDFLRLMAQRTEIKDRVDAYIRVGDRRWDLRLDNGVTVKLPETGVPDALDTLASLQADQEILERDIAAVDLRLSDRVTVSLTEAAAERREAAWNAMLKQRKNAEKRI